MYIEFTLLLKINNNCLNPHTAMKPNLRSFWTICTFKVWISSCLAFSHLLILWAARDTFKALIVLYLRLLDRGELELRFLAGKGMKQLNCLLTLFGKDLCWLSSNLWRSNFCSFWSNALGTIYALLVLRGPTH